MIYLKVYPSEKGKNIANFREPILWYIWVLQILEEGEQTLQYTVAAARKQIQDKQYTRELETREIRLERIRCYGFAFQGKNVLIGWKKRHLKTFFCTGIDFSWVSRIINFKICLSERISAWLLINGGNRYEQNKDSRHRPGVIQTWIGMRESRCEMGRTCISQGSMKEAMETFRIPFRLEDYPQK